MEDGLENYKKKCTKCNMTKLMLSFHVNRGGKWGRRAMCNTCTISRDRQWRFNKNKQALMKQWCKKEEL